MHLQIRPRQRRQHVGHLRRQRRFQRPLGDQDALRTRLGRQRGEERGDAGGRGEVPQAVDQHGVVVDGRRRREVGERVRLDEGDARAERPGGDVRLRLADRPGGA